MINQFSNSIRFLKAVSLLASDNGTTINTLAKNLKISRRSIFRLLNTFEELGFPIIEDKPHLKNEKIYRLSNTYVLKLPNISILNPSLTAEEIIFILAVFNTCRQHNLLNDTPLFNSIEEKLKAILPNGV